MPPIHVYRVGRSLSAAQVASIIRATPSGQQLWLLLPWRLNWGQNLLAFRLLAHTASEGQIDLRVVCARSQVRATAREAGIPPHIMLPSSLRHKIQHLKGPSSDLRTVASSDNVSPRPRHLTLRAFAFALLSTLLVLVAIVGTLAVIVPSAEIVLSPVTYQARSDFTATASPYRRELDYGQALLPARIVQVVFEEPFSMPTTGRVDAPDGYASGEVVFANRTDTEVTIPKGTFVRTGSGQTARFYTVVEATVPAQYNATTRVPIMAAEAGPSSNVRALTINVIEGPLATSLEAVNDAPTAGGTTRQVPVVTVADQNMLLDEAQAQLATMGLSKLSAELDQGEFIVSETFGSQIMSYKYEQAQDERSDVVSMRMEMVSSATVVQRQDLEQLARRFVEAEAGEDLKLIAGTLAVEHGVQQAIKGGEVHFAVTATGQVSQEVDIAHIRHALRGKERSNAAQWLSGNYDLQKAPQITILPPQWERVPVLPARTVVQIEASLP